MTFSVGVPDPHTRQPKRASAPVADDHALDGKLIYFFHIPKTGGRTVAGHLIERFGADGIFHPNRNRSWRTDLFMGEKFQGERTAGDLHVMGHFAPMSLLRGRENAYFKICFWRHPGDWLVSFYNYRHFRLADRMKRSFSFDDFTGSMLRNPMTEHLLLYSGGIRGWAYFRMSDRQKFHAALRLVDRFDQFSDISNVNGFVASVGYTKKGRPVDHNRLGPGQKRIAAIPESMRRRIASTNPVDYFLHRIALGDDRQKVCAQADRTLRPTFDARDLLRLAALPYFRFKIWAWPFLPSLRGRAPEAPDRPPQSADTPTLH